MQLTKGFESKNEKQLAWIMLPVSPKKFIFRKSIGSLEEKLRNFSLRKYLTLSPYDNSAPFETPMAQMSTMRTSKIERAKKTNGKIRHAFCVVASPIFCRVRTTDQTSFDFLYSFSNS